MDEVRQVIRRLRREHLLRDGARLTDGQLLERFVAQRDDAAFEALVELHGPMVFGVCRRILRHCQDAEDAFQATFLVFARKASSIGRRERLANWLFGVARRTALKSRSLNARRTEKQIPLAQIPEPASVGSSADVELEGWLDFEISRLPDTYRLPILICDLEGRPQTEAAQQLGCLPGTLSVRLSRARAMLATRLARRGYALSAATFATLLSQSTASANVPASMSAATATLAATQHSLGVRSVPPQVSTLTQGVLKSMFLAKLKTGVLICSLIIVFGLGAGSLLYQMEAGEAPAPPQAGPAKQGVSGVAKRDTARADQQRELRDAAQQAYEAAKNQYEAGTSTPQEVCQWSRHWFEAEQFADLSRDARVAAANAHLSRMQTLERDVKAKADIGAKGGSELNWQAARYYRIEAEQLVWRMEH